LPDGEKEVSSAEKETVARRRRENWRNTLLPRHVGPIIRNVGKALEMIKRGGTNKKRETQFPAKSEPRP